MNLPNKLTLLRIILVPVFIVFFYLRDALPWWNYYAALVFVGASLTDLFDGAIARKRGIVTNFGKLIDPMADKLLVCSALILLTAFGWVHEVLVIIMVAREFVVSALRMVAAAEGKVLAADSWGKAKTVVQIVAVMFVLLREGAFALIGLETALVISGDVLMIAGAALSVFSCAGYFVKNRAVLKEMF
jgi:CDP-diacylglycerol--glycerol-3-phosphate 3-phosphatidyltransferase